MSNDQNEEHSLGSMQGNSEIWCSVRPQLPAAAFCTVCKRRYSGRYLSVLPDGRAACFRCVSDKKLGTIERVDQTRDPAFRHGLMAGIFGILSGVPRVLAPNYRGPILSALIFGAVCSMIGMWSAMGWFLSSDASQAALQAVVDRMTQQPMTVEELRQAIPWVVPVVAIFRMAFGTLLVHAMIRLVVRPIGNPIKQHARLYALSCVSMLLLTIPGMWGAAAANIIWVLVTLTWVRMLYPSLTIWRVMLVVFPHILLLGMN